MKKYLAYMLSTLIILGQMLPVTYAQESGAVAPQGSGTIMDTVYFQTEPTDTAANSDDAYLSNSDISGFDVNDAVARMKSLQSSVDTLTAQLYAMDATQLQVTSGQQLSDAYMMTRNEIVEVINDITQSNKEMDQMLKKVAVYQQQIAAATSQLKEIRTVSDDTKKTMEQLTLLLYKAGNDLYSPTDNTLDELKLFLYSDNIARTISNEQAVASMLVRFNALLDQLHGTEQRNIAAIRDINAMKNQAMEAIGIYSEELEKMEQKRNYLIQFLDLYQDKELKQSANISQVFQSRNSVHDAIHGLLKEITKKKYTVSFDVISALTEVGQMNNNNSEHPLAWPVYPIDEIKSFFRDPGFEEEYAIPQEGIQIGIRQGTPVYNARDGVVYHVTNTDEVGINWLMILHTDGYVSVYTYMSNILISPGEIVQRGQLLGYSGGEPGTRGAGFVSPGPNLNFSVYRDGEAIDPLKVLDISVVRNKDILSSTYHIKYLRDKYARPIDITQLKLMDGNTDEERASNFLSTYGVGVYRQLSFWSDAVRGTNIDRDMVICVAFAESTLGKYLSTNNNIGNVGNNDRGDRFAFGGALAGARAIAQTLNNQHLGHYHTINQLSRYGNADGKIYASSPINWQTNVLKCLSQIKGYYIPEDFPFRTGPNPTPSEIPTNAKGFDWTQVRVGSETVSQ